MTIRNEVGMAIRNEQAGPAFSYSLFEAAPALRSWQRRFYDFVVWNRPKRTEKLDVALLQHRPPKTSFVPHPCVLGKGGNGSLVTVRP